MSIMILPCPKGYITSKGLAKATGLTLPTVQYYTAIGLLISDKRLGNKHLFVERPTIERVRRIRALRESGYSLALIKRKLGK